MKAKLILMIVCLNLILVGLSCSAEEVADCLYLGDCEEFTPEEDTTQNPTNMQTDSLAVIIES